MLSHGLMVEAVLGEERKERQSSEKREERGGARRREQREATVFGREKLECLRYMLGFRFISINLY